MERDFCCDHLILGTMLTASGAPDDEAAWRDPNEPVDASINPQWYRRMAQLAEAAGLDFLFIADTVFADPAGPPHYLSRFEPLSLLAWLAAATEHIGLVGTFSTSYNEPFNLARKLLSLDHLCGGRAGWNLVTSLGNRAARNFGLDVQLDHQTRYARAEEFIQVVKGLWQSYAPDAFPRDRDSGRYFDATKVRSLEHQGTFFNVAGPLNIERSPQGEPVIFQAGQSHPGQRLAAHSADVVFSMATRINEALDYRAALKAHQQTLGISRKGPLLLQKLIVEIGEDDSSPEEVFRRYAHRHSLESELRQRVARAIEQSLDGVDVRHLAITPQMVANAHANEGSWLSQALHTAMQQGQHMDSALIRLLSAKALVFAGSAQHVAEQMARWYHQGAADGFIIQISNQRCLQDIGDKLVPRLCQQGLFEHHYPAGCTLRQRLGLTNAAGRGDAQNALASLD